MKSTKEKIDIVLDDMAVTARLMAESARRLGEEMKTPEYKEKERRAREQNKNWHEVEIA
jgi:hypothetical protein